MWYLHQNVQRCTEVGKQRSSSTDFISLRTGSLSTPGGGWVENDCSEQRGQCSFEAWFQLQNICQLSLAGPCCQARLTDSCRARQKRRSLEPADLVSAKVCHVLVMLFVSHAIAAMVFLYDRGTADLVLSWQVSTAYNWPSISTLSLSAWGHLQQKVGKSVLG